MRKKIRILLFFIIISLSVPAVAQDQPDAYKEYKNKNYQSCVDICFNDLKANPANMDAYVILGWGLFRLGRYNDVVEWSLKGLQYSKNDMRVIVNLGEAYYFLGDNDNAMKYLQTYTANVHSGQYVDYAYYYMGEIYIRLGEYNKADIALSAALYHSQKSAKWWSRLGYAREMAGDNKYALEAYEQSLKINPSYTEAARGKARVQNKLDS